MWWLVPREHAIKQSDYSFSCTLVRPTGTESFVKKLSDVLDLEKLKNRENNIKKVDITTAFHRIKDVKPDLALVHFLYLKIMISHRIHPFELVR